MKPTELLQKSADFFKTAIAEQTSGMMTGFLLSITAGASVFLTPVREYVFRLIFTENAQVELKLPAKFTVSLGKEFPIQTAIYSLSPVPVSGGILTLIYPTDAFDLQGKDIYKTQIIKDVNLFPENEKTVLVAKAAGTFPIVTQLRTKFKIYSDTSIVTISNSSGKPSKINFTGKWTIKIGIELGEMNIVEGKPAAQDNRSIVGTYSLTHSAERGTIDGFRDGSITLNFFKQGRQPQRRSVSIEFPYVSMSNDGKFLRLSGIAQYYTYAIDDWQQVDSKSVKFEAFGEVE